MFRDAARAATPAGGEGSSAVCLNSPTSPSPEDQIFFFRHVQSALCNRCQVGRAVLGRRRPARQKAVCDSGLECDKLHDNDGDIRMMRERREWSGGHVSWSRGQKAGTIGGAPRGLRAWLRWAQQRPETRSGTSRNAAKDGRTIESRPWKTDSNWRRRSMRSGQSHTPVRLLLQAFLAAGPASGLYLASPSSHSRGHRLDY